MPTPSEWRDKQVADFLEENLKPLGVAVALEAEHMCMTIRGVQVPGTQTYTAAMRGRFSEHDRTAKAEFLARINGGVKMGRVVGMGREGRGWQG